MSEKMRGALFNALGDIKGLTFLDAFAGSGALGFEALSRGAQYVIAVDIDKQAVATITSNAAGLKVSDRIKPIRANIAGWMQTEPDSQFDVVIADPPYDKLPVPTLEKIAGRVKTRFQHL
jgi:16S rRNA (guanine966-N2)-methyltransferase